MTFLRLIIPHVDRKNFDDIISVKDPEFKVGDYIGTFEKGYAANWTEEIFRVTGDRRGDPNVYY